MTAAYCVIIWLCLYIGAEIIGNDTAILDHIHVVLLVIAVMAPFIFVAVKAAKQGGDDA
jgi:hypothetical protein